MQIFVPATDLSGKVRKSVRSDSKPYPCFTNSFSRDCHRLLTALFSEPELLCAYLPLRLRLRACAVQVRYSMIKTHFAAKRREKRNKGKVEAEKIDTAENDAKLAIKEKVISLSSQVRPCRSPALARLLLASMHVDSDVFPSGIRTNSIFAYLHAGQNLWRQNSSTRISFPL